MKIVHINIGDTGGGAAIAARRHCEAMRRAGIDAQMLVLSKQSGLPWVHEACRGRWARLWLRVRSRVQEAVMRRFRPWGAFSAQWCGLNLAKHSLVREADIIYIHWVAAGMLSARGVERVLRLGKPVRWYMHDMNPITGGCHYAMDCAAYQQGCAHCPLLGAAPLGLDLARRQFRERLRRWSRYPNLEAYTPSAWLGACVERSALWRGRRVTVFPNVLDTAVFRPVARAAARELLGVPQEKCLLLFGAAQPGSPYKGWKYMRGALALLPPDRYEALVFGGRNDGVEAQLTLRCHFTGFLHDDLALVLVYNAADVFVSASLADNYPNVIIEAMACGLPCVGTRVGGIPDQITHLVNGYLAEPRSSASLAEGIRAVCEQPADRREAMQQAAREFVCRVAGYEVYKREVIGNN